MGHQVKLLATNLEGLFSIPRSRIVKGQSQLLNCPLASVGFYKNPTLWLYTFIISHGGNGWRFPTCKKQTATQNKNLDMKVSLCLVPQILYQL